MNEGEYMGRLILSGDVLKNALGEKGDEKSCDYSDSEGLLVCGKCNTRKQKDVKVPTSFKKSGVWRVPVPCLCRLEEIKLEEERRQKMEFEFKMQSLQRDGITDTKYLDFTFEQDDGRDSKVSDVCKKYVEKWDDMRADNIGMLLYGDVGAGKSFMACCIANALLKRLVSVSVTNFPRLLDSIQKDMFRNNKNSNDDVQQSIADRLQKYSLLVIDDLGVERDTSYSIEQIFNIIDTRSRSGKPTIITTNLSMNDIKNPVSLAHKRIYDRILEMCPILLKFEGESRRIEKAANKREKARRLLGL